MVLYGYEELRYFTNWGVNITCISFCILAYCHINEMINTKNNGQHVNVYSPWMSEKWAIFFSQLALTFEGVIVIFYWCILFPLHGHVGYSQWEVIQDYINHAVPVTVLFLDFVMNVVPFHFRHLPFFLGIMIIYGFGVNMTVTLVSGTPVYTPLTWKTPMSWAYVGGLLTLAVISFSTWYFISVRKNKKYLSHLRQEKYVTSPDRQSVDTEASGEYRKLW